MYCFKCIRKTKNQKCDECNIFKLSVLDEAKIEVVSDKLQHYANFAGYGLVIAEYGLVNETNNSKIFF